MPQIPLLAKKAHLGFWVIVYIVCTIFPIKSNWQSFKRYFQQENPIFMDEKKLYEYVIAPLNYVLEFTFGGKLGFFEFKKSIRADAIGRVRYLWRNVFFEDLFRLIFSDHFVKDPHYLPEDVEQHLKKLPKTDPHFRFGPTNCIFVFTLGWAQFVGDYFRNSYKDFGLPCDKSVTCEAFDTVNGAFLDHANQRPYCFKWPLEHCLGDLRSDESLFFSDPDRVWRIQKDCWDNAYRHYLGIGSKKRKSQSAEEDVDEILKLPFLDGTFRSLYHNQKIYKSDKANKMYEKWKIRRSLIAEEFKRIYLESRKAGDTIVTQQVAALDAASEPDWKRQKPDLHSPLDNTVMV